MNTYGITHHSSGPPPAAAELKRQVSTVNTRCPECDSELRGRYLGAFALRYPSRKTLLKMNLHGSESQSVLEEPLLYVGGFVLLVILMVISSSLELSVILLAVSGVLYVAARIYLWSKAIPSE